MPKTKAKLQLDEGLILPLGAAGGRVMTSDASGNAAWTDPLSVGSSFVSGSGAPTAGVGVNGAIYLDTATGRLWGPKAAGAWPGAAFGRIVPLIPTYAQLASG